jgi:threonylcarbamoyladenosine tRNA methylthiotransferase CDKAL1
MMVFNTFLPEWTKVITKTHPGQHCMAPSQSGSGNSLPQKGLADLTGKRVYIETYGCRYNFGDTVKLKEILKRQRCTVVPSEEDADAVIINTCTVVAATERRMLRRLSRFRNGELYVTGCMAVIQREAIMAVCTPTIILPQKIHDMFCGAGMEISDHGGIVQIAQGCAGHCSYCITRSARGALKSFPEEEILDQVRAFANSGVAEIQLTAQDSSAWGRDTGRSLPDLLSRISSIYGTFYIRVGMMNPATVISILDDLVDAFAQKSLFRFIHIPVQSGSDRVLEEMGRGYSCEQFEHIVATFRKRYPDITLVTDMIVGFPTETEDDFEESLNLLHRVRPNKVNITRFSKRPHTRGGSKMEIPDSIKKERSRTMHAHAEELYHAINAPIINKNVPIIVTERIRKGSVLARSPSYLGIALHEDLPIGFTGHATILKEHMYFFSGKRCPGDQVDR